MHDGHAAYPETSIIGCPIAKFRDRGFSALDRDPSPGLRRRAIAESPEQSLDDGDQLQGLIQHYVVMGISYFDERRAGWSGFLFGTPNLRGDTFGQGSANKG
jgi:hypothetical protein